MGRTKSLRYRHLRRTVIAVLAAVAFLLVMGRIGWRILHSRSVERTVVAWVEATAEAAGVAVEIEGLGWGVMPPSLSLRDVTVRTGGLEAELQRVHVTLAGLRLTDRSIALGDVIVHGARVRYRGDLPRPVGDGPRLRLSVARLDLREVTLEGAVTTRRIAGSIRDLDAGWVTEAGTARGFLLCPRIELEVGGMEPILGRLRARLELADSLRVPYLEVAATGLQLTGDGAVDRELVRLDLAGTLDLAELDRTVHAGRQLAGLTRIGVTVDTAAPAPLDVAVRADRLRAWRFRLADVAGSLRIGSDGLDGQLDQARLLGGRASGRYRLPRLRRPYRHDLEVVATGVELPRLLATLGVPPAGLAARGDLEIELAWTGRDLPGGAGLGTAVLAAADGELPAAGTVRARLDRDGLIQLEGDDLRIGRSRVSWQGPLAIDSWQPAWSIRADPAELAEVVTLLNRWARNQVLPEIVGGQGVLAVGLSGPWSDLVVSTRLDAAPLAIGPVALDRVVGDATVTGDRVAIGPVRFRLGDGDGEVEGSVSWGDRASEEALLDLELRGREVPLAEIARWIDLGPVATGDLAFTGVLRGDPAEPRGSWAIGLTDVTLLGERLGDAAGNLGLDDGRFSLSRLAFDRGLTGDVSWDVGRRWLGVAAAWPRMPLAVLGARLEAPLGDVGSAELEMSWFLDELPTGHASLTTAAVELDAEATSGEVTLSGAAEGVGRGRLALERTAAGDLEGAGELHLESARELVARLAPTAEIPLTGTAEASLEVRWPAAGLPRATGRLETIDLRLDERPIRLVEPASFSLDLDRFELGGLFLEVDGDEVFARGAVGVDGGLRGNLSGTFDALLLRFLLPEWEPAGRATGVVELLGRVDRPRLEGIAEVANGSFKLPGTRTILSGIDGTVLLSSDEATLDGVSFRLMHGLARAAGRIFLQDGVFHLALSGSVRGLDYPLFPGLEPRLTGTWRLDGPVDDLLLSGDLEVTRATLRRKDDLATLLLDWFGGETSPAGEAGLNLDLRVEADRTLQARSPSLNLEGSAALHISGTSTDPGLVGTVELGEGSEFTFQGVRYEIDRGTITFTDPLEIDPRIELQAEAWVQSYRIGIGLAGTLDRLTPTVSSDPPLPQSEVWSLLGMGLRDEAVGEGSLGVGLASTLLTRELNSELQRRAQMVLPVDQLRVDPFAETSTGNPTARITVVKQLNPRWTVILQSNLSANREEVIVSRWFLSPGLFVEATRDVDGSYALDLKLRRRY